MNRLEFMKALQPIIPPEGVLQVTRAYWLAKEMHRRQVRDGRLGMNLLEIMTVKLVRLIGTDLQVIKGERYFEHCRRVALQVVEWGSHDADEITAALLHDCVEDCHPPQGLLESLFPAAVIDAIGILSKKTPTFDAYGGVKSKRKKSQDEYYAAVASAPAWVRRIKLADRLDNLRSMHVWSHARKQKYLGETDAYILSIAKATDEKLYQALIEECSHYR